MGFVTKIELCKLGKEIERIFLHHGIALEQVYAYGWVTNQIEGASAALNLFIKDTETPLDTLKQIEQALSALMPGEVVEVNTLNSLNLRTESIYNISFPLPTEKINNIKNHCVPLRSLMDEGERQLKQAAELKEKIKLAKFSGDLDKIPIAEFTKQQRDVLIELGMLIHEMGEDYYTDNNVFSYLEKDQEIGSVIKYASKWNIHQACVDNNLDIVKAILETKDCINLHEKRFGSTPLHAAINVNATRIIKFLVSKNADILATNNKGLTCKQLAGDKRVDLSTEPPDPTTDPGCEMKFK